MTITVTAVCSSCYSETSVTSTIPPDDGSASRCFSSSSIIHKLFVCRMKSLFFISFRFLTDTKKWSSSAKKKFCIRKAYFSHNQNQLLYFLLDRPLCHCPFKLSGNEQIYNHNRSKTVDIVFDAKQYNNLSITISGLIINQKEKKPNNNTNNKQLFQREKKIIESFCLPFHIKKKLFLTSLPLVIKYCCI